jgi:glycosyltransferase involved in cell wall biosynthesis
MAKNKMAQVIKLKNNNEPTVLISTLSSKGGVSAMTKFAVQALKAKNYEPIVAYYKPYSLSPALSVPATKLFRKKPSFTCFHDPALDVTCYEVGAYLPELEFTHYWPTAHWKALAEQTDYHLVASGNVMPAMPFYNGLRPYIVWAATSHTADRVDRVKHFSWPRKVLDVCLNKRVSARYEKKIIQQGHVLSTSQYTKKSFIELGMAKNSDILPVPVDTQAFVPHPETVKPWRIGFSGRLNDARKNIRLLVEALAQLKASGKPIELFLIGATLDDAGKALLSSYQLMDETRCVGYVAREKLPGILASLDVFVIPSHQEGLCIAGLEAMSCGCPVVSTRCGGPEDFVIDDQTGYLTGFDAQAIADRVERVCADRPLRKRLSEAATALVNERYSISAARAIFWQHFTKVFL